MDSYAIGVDFGTLSARAVLIHGGTGAVLAERTHAYAHGVMEEALPCGVKLEKDWALQDPTDYIEAFVAAVSSVVRESGVPPEQIVGIGVDFTACTILPVKRDGTPLCFLPEFEKNPHAYVKLWKHHSAQYCADRLNQVAKERKEPWLDWYGGKVSCEWLVPKVMQILQEAPEIYEQADKIIEAGDWLIWQLCGEEKRSACNAGYKALWNAETGYPEEAFFAALDERLRHFTRDKLSPDIYPLGGRAGYLTPAMAEKTGLTSDTAVGIGIIDAHASVPGTGVDAPGKMLMIMGTSTCHMILGKDKKPVPGICGVVKDGVLPGYYAYEAGQSCVGDHFSWLVNHFVPGEYFEQAAEQGMNIHEYLRRKASSQQPGENGLVALDWWNGVRSPLMDFDLTGLMVGMKLSTRAEDVYRALIEATAYGTRKIIEGFEQEGIPVEELYAAGGIAAKDPMTMQIYADVCNREIRIAASAQSGALGSAVLGLVAAGPRRSGYSDVSQAVSAIGKISAVSYKPVEAHVKAYNKLYGIYCRLYELFGVEERHIMKELKEIRN
jgi:L-ribulokinase